MKSTDKILKEIRYWINAYHTEKDNGVIEILLKIQDEIAIRTFTLAQYVGDYKTSYNASYFIRKIGVAKSSLSYQKNGHTLGKSDHQALIDNADNYEQEQAHEATAVTLELLLKQTNVILQAMQQRISFYKSEKQATNRQNQT